MSTETTSTLELLSFLTPTEQDAISSKFAAQPKATKKLVRALETEGSEAEQYAVFILKKIASDYINGQMRDVWIQRLEMLVPRVFTSDEKLKTQTETAIASIALEVTDVDMRDELIVILKKNLLPKTTDMLNTVKCIERASELFKIAYGKDTK